MKFILTLALCAGIALSATAPARADGASPKLESIYLGGVTGPAKSLVYFAFGADGRIYGSESGKTFLSFKSDGSDFKSHDANPEKIQLIGSSPPVLSSTGVFYQGAFPNDLNNEFQGISCPYVYTDVSSGNEPVTREVFGFIYRFSGTLAPEKLSRSLTVPVCPVGPAAVAPNGQDFYFFSQIKSALLPQNASATGARIYKIALDGSAISEVYRFGSGDFPLDDDRASPIALQFSQDGQWLYGINAGLAPYIYRVKPDGQGFQKLADLTADSGTPASATGGTLIEAGDYLYGTGQRGGNGTNGAVFRVKKDGSEPLQILHRFNRTDGRRPDASLALAGDGWIYGTTQQGGTANSGTAFRINPQAAGAVEPAIYTFTGDTAVDGSFPRALQVAPNGKLYGLANVTDEIRLFALNIGYVPPGPVITLTASPTEVPWTNGTAQPTTLTWAASGAVSCSASGDWSGAKGTAASETVTPTREGDNTYTLTCDNGSGLPTATATQSLTIKAVAPPPPVAIKTFAASPLSVVSGGTITLAWTTENALSCTGSWVGSPLASEQLAAGSASVSPGQEPGEKTYTLTCQGQTSGDTQSQQVKVTVTLPTSGDGSGIRSESGGGPLTAWLLLPLAGLVMRRRLAAIASR